VVDTCDYIVKVVVVTGEETQPLAGSPRTRFLGKHGPLSVLSVSKSRLDAADGPKGLWERQADA
jgi:hypothetical protein